MSESDTHDNHARAAKRPGLMQRARAARKRGDLQAALALYRRIPAEHPKFLDAILQAAAVLRELGRLDEAEAELERALQQDPTLLSALMERAAVARARGDDTAALEYYGNAARYHPNREEPVVERTAVLRKLGRLDEADAEIDALLEHQPNHLRALLQRGMNAEARETGSGRPWFERAMAAHPNNPMAYLRLANCMTNSGEGSVAYTLLSDACDRFTQKPQVAQRCAVMDWQQGRLEDAFERIQELAKRFPQQFSIWRQLVNWTIDLGRFDEAVRLLERAASFLPKQRGAIAALRVKLAARQFDFATACELQREALAPADAGADAHEKLAQYSLYLLELEPARQHLQQSVQIKRALRGTSAEGKARVGLGIRGVWLNEFSVNPFVTEQLRRVLALPHAEQPAAFADILREEPGHTPTAIMLMIRLRREGRFQAWREAAGAPDWPVRIPRRIVQFWDSAEVPSEVSALMDSWPRVCAGFEYQRFDEASARRFLKTHYHGAVVRAFQKCQTVPMKADVFRLAYLFREGGVYVDADDYCRHPLDRLGRTDADLMLYQEEQGSLGNNFIAAAPGHPVIGDALDHAVREILESSRGDTWFTTGPGQMTRAAARQLRPFMRFNSAADTGPSPRWIVLDRHELLACVSIHVRCNYHRSGRSWQRAEAQEVRLVAARQM